MVCEAAYESSSYLSLIKPRCGCEAERFLVLGVTVCNGKSWGLRSGPRGPKAPALCSAHVVSRRGACEEGTRAFCWQWGKCPVSKFSSGHLHDTPLFLPPRH